MKWKMDGDNYVAITEDSHEMREVQHARDMRTAINLAIVQLEEQPPGADTRPLELLRDMIKTVETAKPPKIYPETDKEIETAILIGEAMIRHRADIEPDPSNAADYDPIEDADGWRTSILLGLMHFTRYFECPISFEGDLRNARDIYQSDLNRLQKYEDEL